MGQQNGNTIHDISQQTGGSGLNDGISGINIYP